MPVVRADASSKSPNHQLQLAYMRDRLKAAEMQFLHGVPFDQRLSVTRVLNGLAIPSRDVEELARGEANTLGVKLPKLLIQGKTYLARYKEVADMIQDSNNYHAKHLRESPVEAFVDWKIERKTRLANETLKEIPLTPIPTPTEPQEPAPE